MPTRGIWGAGLQTSWQENYYNFIYQNGGTLLNEDLTECIVDSPRSLRGVRLSHRLLRRRV